MDEKYSELDLDYVREFVTENGISSDFKLFSLLDENGLPSGLGKCSACEDKFQVWVQFTKLYRFFFWELALKLHVRLVLKFKSEPQTRKLMDILGFVSL